ncbi:MAG: family 10 glycosylhydrolase [Candidatus Marinimicrobia bacterium]|nr:family 10 glycosylhydrolase [Candidatus Neomarinimicrobiota bacterium]MCF7827501.1 family 10 glycosylhydrolase [Candidatus Neomarinimicrobiota bacterium]
MRNPIRFTYLIRKATISVAFLFIFWALPLNVFSQESDTPMTDQFFKGLWVIRNNMTDSSSIKEVVEFASDNGFRQILVQVRGRGFAYYTSSFVPRSYLITEPQFDPLAYAIEKGHEAGLEVHAWMNMYVLWTAETEPPDPNHLLLTQPEWTDADNNGVMYKDKDWNLFRNGLRGGIYLAPTHPAVNPYLKSVVKEVVENYNVDGIHLDYIRYQNVVSGYNPAGRETFRNKYGVDPLLLSQITQLDTVNWDERSYQIYIDAWNAHRRDQVTQLVSSLKTLCEQHGTKLSAAVKPNVNDARSRFFQDWEYWIEEGYLDLAIPMNYAKDLELFMSNLQLIREKLPRDQVAMGIAVYNQSQFDVAEKILKTLSAQYEGFCLFSYNSFVENPTYIDVIRRFVKIE